MNKNINKLIDDNSFVIKGVVLEEKESNYSSTSVSADKNRVYSTVSHHQDQKIWYKTEGGKEDSVYLYNRNVEFRSGHEIILIYSKLTNSLIRIINKTTQYSWSLQLSSPPIGAWSLLFGFLMTFALLLFFSLPVLSFIFLIIYIKTLKKNYYPYPKTLGILRIFGTLSLIIGVIIQGIMLSDIDAGISMKPFVEISNYFDLNSIVTLMMPVIPAVILLALHQVNEAKFLSLIASGLNNKVNQLQHGEFDKNESDVENADSNKNEPCVESTNSNKNESDVESTDSKVNNVRQLFKYLLIGVVLFLAFISFDFYKQTNTEKSESLEMLHGYWDMAQLIIGGVSVSTEDREIFDKNWNSAQISMQNKWYFTPKEKAAFPMLIKMLEIDKNNKLAINSLKKMYEFYGGSTVTKTDEGIKQSNPLRMLPYDAKAEKTKLLRKKAIKQAIRNTGSSADDFLDKNPYY